VFAVVLGTTMTGCQALWDFANIPDPEGARHDFDPVETSVQFHPVDPSMGSIAAVLQSHNAQARARGLRPFVYLHATWCPPCRAIENSRHDRLMLDAFQGTYIIEMDIDAWTRTALDQAGMQSDSIPRFYPLGPSAQVIPRTITGAAWGEDIPANMAPPLRAFFRRN
jgi:hypothetical protein